MPKPHELLDVGRRLSVHSGVFADHNAAAVLAELEGGHGPDASWDEVLAKRICLLVGRANTGKTCELELLRRRLQAEGRTVFLLPLRALYERRSTDDLFQRGDEKAFKQWSASKVDEAIFLLDSIDEVDLFREGAFANCLVVLRRILGDARLLRARWVISSRPGSWSSSHVVGTIRRELCPDEVQEREDTGSDADASHTKSVKLPEPEVAIAALKPLNNRQARQFLRQVFGVKDTSNVEDLAHNLGLSFALQSPGDLKWFSQLATAPTVPRSRREAFELAARALATARTLEMTAGLDEVVSELESLSAASVLCENELFALREAPAAAGGLPLSVLLGHRDYPFEQLVKALPLVSDSGFQCIKLIPGQVRQYLAAKWFARQCRTEADEAALFDLFQHESLAGPLVLPHLQVCAGWLSAMLPAFRRRLLGVAPHAVLFLGDLAQLTPEEGAEAIVLTFEKLATGHPCVPTALSLTGDDYWHIARPDLTSVLVDALGRFGSSELCALHLLKVFAFRGAPAAVPALRKYFAENVHSLRHRRLCLEALEECGGIGDLEWAAGVALGTEELCEELAVHVACALIRHGGDTRLIARACSNPARDPIGQRYLLAKAAAEAPGGRAVEYASALLDGVGGESPPSGEADTTTGDEATPIAPALALLLGYLRSESTSDDLADEVIRLLEVARLARRSREGHGQFADFLQHTKALPRFRRKALSVLALTLEPDEAYQLARGSGYLYVEFDTADIDLIADVQRGLAGSRAAAVLAYLVQRLTPSSSVPPRRVSGTGLTKYQRQEAKEKAELKAELQLAVVGIRTASDVPRLVCAATLASNGNDRSRYGHADWAGFASFYGDDVAAAAQEGVKQLWRSHPPLFDPTSPDLTFHRTIAGLVGLQLELGREGGFDALSPAETARAFEYAPFELNQFPEWVPELAKRSPATFDGFVVKTLNAWADSPVAEQNAVHVLERVCRDGALPLSPEVMLAAWSALVNGAWKSDYALSTALGFLLRNVGALGQATTELTRFAAERSKSLCDLGSLPLFSLWFTAWIELEPLHALSWLEARAAGDVGAWTPKLVALADHWQETTTESLTLRSLNEVERCDALSRVYLLLMQAVPPEDEEVKAVVRRRSARGQAAWFRDSLVSRIASVGGRAAFEVLYLLAVHSDVREYEMRWLHRVALTVAERAAKGPAWTAQQFRDYANYATAPLLDPQGLWRAVCHDVDEAIRNLREGSFSPRCLLLEAHEKDVQLWLAREVELLSRGRYKVTREPELANGTTPDITAQSKAGHTVTLELKVGGDRSIPSLLRDLQTQLHDDYMQDRNSGFGLFVVMWQETRDLEARGALHAKVRKVEAALQKAAKATFARSGGRKCIDVRCFICPTDVSPRNEAKAAQAEARKQAQEV